MRNELFLVFVRELFEIVELGLVDGVDLLGRDGDVGEERELVGVIVGVVGGEGEGGFVAEEYFP